MSLHSTLFRIRNLFFALGMYRYFPEPLQRMNIELLPTKAGANFWFYWCYFRENGRWRKPETVRLAQSTKARHGSAHACGNIAIIALLSQMEFSHTQRSPESHCEIISVWVSPILLHVRTEQKEFKLLCMLTLIQTRKVRKNADFKYVHLCVFRAKDWQVNDDKWKIKCLLTKIIVPFKSAFVFTFCVFGSCFRRPAINFFSDVVVVAAVVVVVVNTYLSRHDPSVKMVQS